MTSSALSGRFLFRRRAVALIGAGTVARFTGGAQAQAVWKPKQPIIIYNSFTAGGPTDAHLRLLADRVSRTLDQRVLVEVKAGVAGTLGASQMQYAKPDGYLLACMGVSSLRYPHYQQTSWHPLRDFSYIIGLSSFTITTVVATASPWKTVDELVAAGKAKPNTYTYASSGIGGTGHLTMLAVEQATGARFVNVPYKGGAECMQAVLGGHVDFSTDGVTCVPFVEAGQMRLLATATESRTARFPEVPTYRDRGIDVVGHAPYGLIGPANLPAPIVQTLHDAFKAAMDDPGIKEFLDKQTQPIWYKSPAEFRAFAEKYFEEVKPELVAAGLAKG